MHLTQPLLRPDEVLTSVRAELVEAGANASTGSGRTVHILQGRINKITSPELKSGPEKFTGGVTSDDVPLHNGKSLPVTIWGSLLGDGFFVGE